MYEKRWICYRSDSLSPSFQRFGNVFGTDRLQGAFGHGSKRLIADTEPRPEEAVSTNWNQLRNGVLGAAQLHIVRR